ALRDEVLEQLPRARGTVSVGTLREHAALRLYRLGGAEWALCRRTRPRRPALALGHMRCRREDLRDHVPGPQHYHLLASPDVLSCQVLLVVQGGQIGRAHV